MCERFSKKYSANITRGYTYMYSSSSLVRNSKHVYESNCYFSRLAPYVFISRGFSNGKSFLGRAID